MRELALWVLLYPLYLLTREGATGAFPTALEHAREIVAAERAIGLAIERGMQQLVTSLPLGQVTFDSFYEWAFYPLLGAVLVWLALTHRDLYRSTRRALFVALALAAILFLLFPTAPPRMLPNLGIRDTVGMQAHDVDSFHGIPLQSVRRDAEHARGLVADRRRRRAARRAHPLGAGRRDRASSAHDRRRWLTSRSTAPSATRARRRSRSSAAASASAAIRSSSSSAIPRAACTTTCASSATACC